MRPATLITRFLSACLLVFLVLVTVLPLIQSSSLAQKNNHQLSPIASVSGGTAKAIGKVNAPSVVMGSVVIWDNGDFDGVNGLASEINTAISDARTADDFMLTDTTKIGFVTTQMLSSVVPQTAQLEIYANLGTEMRPIDGTPIATYPAVSFTQIGNGFDYPLIEFVFETPGLTLTSGKYWVNPIVVDNGSGRGFFATTGGGAVKLEVGHFKSGFFGFSTWTPVSNLIGSTDFAFKVYGAQGIDHSTVYAADTNNNRIQRSTDDGATWQMVGYGPGVTAGKFNAPRGVSASSNDMVIFVADTNNNRIQRSTNGGINWQVIAGAGVATGQVNKPYGLAYDEGSDKLYVADTLNNRIQVAINATSSIPAFSIFAGATAGTAIGKFNQPIGIAVSADSNNVYVTDTSNNRIQVYSINDATWAIYAGATAGTAVGKVNQPHGIYVDNDGRVYVADRNNNRIQMRAENPEKALASEGWTVFMGPGVTLGFVNAPCGVVYTNSGHVFVGDTFNNRVQKKNLVTGVVTIVGQAGTQAGQFYQPTSMR